MLLFNGKIMIIQSHQNQYMKIQNLYNLIQTTEFVFPRNLWQKLQNFKPQIQH